MAILPSSTAVCDGLCGNWDENHDSGNGTLRNLDARYMQATAMYCGRYLTQMSVRNLRKRRRTNEKIHTDGEHRSLCKPTRRKRSQRRLGQAQRMQSEELALMPIHR